VNQTLRTRLLTLVDWGDTIEDGFLPAGTRVKNVRLADEGGVTFTVIGQRVPHWARADAAKDAGLRVPARRSKKKRRNPAKTAAEIIAKYGGGPTRTSNVVQIYAGGVTVAARLDGYIVHGLNADDFRTITAFFAAAATAKKTLGPLFAALEKAGIKKYKVRDTRRGR
jgi:hypothetical protein